MSCVLILGFIFTASLLGLLGGITGDLVAQSALHHVEQRREEKAVLNRIFSLEGERSRAVKDFCGCGERTASCSELWFRRQFIDAIQDRIHEGRDSLQDVRQRIAGTEACLVERHRDVRVNRLLGPRGHDQGTAVRMRDYVETLDNILKSTGEDVLKDAGKISHKQAMEKATTDRKSVV